LNEFFFVGGPLTLEIEPDRRIVVGIVSFGAAAGCTLEHPAVFSRVTSFLDWIDDTISGSNFETDEATVDDIVTQQADERTSTTDGVGRIRAVSYILIFNLVMSVLFN
jgi:secreted trypsin-like serine protease